MRDPFVCSPIRLPKREASRTLIPALNTLLDEHKITLQDLPYIVVNRGPAPFTSLRVVLATVNGLALATGIPLIGVDGLIAGLEEYAHPDYDTNLYLLNAFGGDVYFALKNGQKSETGYTSLTLLLDRLKQRKNTIYCFGNGAILHHELLQELGTNKIVIPEPNPHTASLKAIAQRGQHHGETNKGDNQSLQPLYLKEHRIALNPSNNLKT